MLTCLQILLAFASIVYGIEIPRPNTIFEIGDGKVQGLEHRTVGQNKPYLAFRGIPYAQPPVGNLRFRPPLPAKKWTGILNATTDGNICLQQTESSNEIIGSEDCLTINVYTPAVRNGSLPVMVWIYGGGFEVGDSTYQTYGPDYLLDNDNIIFVSFNYRLSIFGYVSTGDLAAPGNIGTKDQILALRWVQSNIAFFGGDPRRVTIVGESSGAASVIYLLQIPQAKGLFHGAIAESGSSLSPWALSRKSRQAAFQVGEHFNIRTNDSQVLIDGLRNVNAKQLLEAAVNISHAGVALSNVRNGLIFAPVAEPEHPGAVFTQKSHELLRKGQFTQVPTIIGVNSLEALNPYNLISVRLYNGVAYLPPREIVPVDANVKEDQKDRVGREIKTRYFGTAYPRLCLTEHVLDFITDDQFKRGIRETVAQVSKYSPVYYYIFSYVGNMTGITHRPIHGAGHTEEMAYLFRTYNNFSTSEKDALTRSRLTKLWTNFAKTLNPTPVEDPLLGNVTWPSASLLKNDLLYLDIDDDLEVKLNPDNANMRFWNIKVYLEYGHPPYDTY